MLSTCREVIFRLIRFCVHKYTCYPDMIHMQLFHYLTLYADRQNENKVLLIIHPHIVGNNLGILCIRSLGFFKISYERLFFISKWIRQKRLVRLYVNINTHQKEPGTRPALSENGTSENRWLRLLMKRVIFRRCSASLLVKIEETKILHNPIICIVQYAWNYIDTISARETTSEVVKHIVTQLKLLPVHLISVLTAAPSV